MADETDTDGRSVDLHKNTGSGPEASNVDETGDVKAASPTPTPTPTDAPAAEKAAVEEPAAAVTPPAVAAPAGPRWPKRVVVIASVLLIAVIAAGVWLLLDRQSAAERDERRAAFVQAARQTVLNLTTIRADSADADVQRLIEGATGDFKAEFEGREGPFVEVVQQAGVTTVGEVLEAGIQNEDGTCASSLVASRAMVSNADQTEPEPRDFRLRVTICDENGRLLASKVEFVP